MIIIVQQVYCCVCPLCAPPYTTEKPIESDVVGLYVLAGQTLTEERLDILQGRTCEIDLQSDGTFSVTNFPVWAEASALRYELDTLFLRKTSRFLFDSAKRAHF